jgi:hypothetical protein
MLIPSKYDWTYYQHAEEHRGSLGKENNVILNAFISVYNDRRLNAVIRSALVIQ